LLNRLGYKNVNVRLGDGYAGWPEQAPFDRIILTAAPPKIPQALLDQLKPGGRLVAPEGDRYQELVVIDKNADGSLTRRPSIPVMFVPMVRGTPSRDKKR
jgi:protein-L-isoaspartate(D-aspartate) O-methyltransferase